MLNTLNDPNIVNSNWLQLLAIFFAFIYEKFGDAIMGMAGGGAMYFFLYQRARDKAEKSGNPMKFKFRMGSFLISAGMGAFIAYIFGSLVPDFTGRDAIIGIIGLISYQIMAVIESNALQYIVDRWVNTGTNLEYRKNRKDVPRRRRKIPDDYHEDETNIDNT